MIEPGLNPESNARRLVNWTAGQEMNQVSSDDLNSLSSFSPATDQAIRSAADQEDQASSSNLIKIYLQDMGQIQLLSKGKEIELARQIERAEMALVTALLQTDLSLTELESLYQEVQANPEEIGRWFNLPGNDYSPANVKKAAERASASLASIRKLALRLKSLPVNKKNKFNRARLGLRIRQQVLGLDLRWDKKYELVDKIKQNLKDKALVSSREERVKLQRIGEQIDQASRLRRQAMNELIAANLRLVISIA